MTVPFTESLRHEIQDLKPHDVIIDVGGYEGNWSRIVVEKYGCSALIFEPIKSFHAQISESLATHPLRRHFDVINSGVGATSGETTMGVKGDSSGVAADGPQETVSIIGVDRLFNNLKQAWPPEIACMKLNCESSEFPILEAMLAQDLVKHVRTIHVQFHNIVPNAQARMDAIIAGICKTHDILWDAPWCWIGFQRKRP